MRLLIFPFIISFFVMSCGHNETKQKELELKEKEIALKEKELELKEKEEKTDSNSISHQQTNKVNDNTITSGIYTVKPEKSYFYNSADPSTIRKGYMVKGDIISIQKIDGDFAYGIYRSASGSQITGWVLSTDLEKSTNGINPNKPTTAKFLVKSNALVLLVNQKEFIIEKDFGPAADLTLESEPNKLAVASIYGGSGWTTYSASLQKNGDIIVKETLFYRIQGELNSESRTMLKVKSGNY